MRKILLLFCLLPLLLISQRGVDQNTYQYTVRYIQDKLYSGDWNVIAGDTADFITYLNLDLTPIAVHDSCDSVRKQIRDTTIAIGEEQWSLLYADTSRWAQKIDTNYTPFQDYVDNHAGAGASASDVGDSCDNVRSVIRDTVAVSTSDSTAKIDTNYVPFQAYVANHNSDYMSDTADAVRAQIRDTINVWWGDTSAVYAALPQVSDTADVLRLEWVSDIGDTATVLRGNMDTKDNAVLAAIRDTIDIMYYDTLWFASATDTNYVAIDANGKIQVGDIGLGEADSFKIGGGDVIKKWVTVGSHFGFILANDDTMWATADTL